MSDTTKGQTITDVAVAAAPQTNAGATGTLNERKAYAAALSGSNLLPKSYHGKPANVLVALEYGLALGISPMAAIQGVHVVEGKPTASAQLMSALVRNAGHRLRVTGDDTHAVAIIVRRDDPDFEWRSEWDMEKAKQAGLAAKGVWKQYPGAMLKARAITEVCRDACAEVLAGVAYTAEELEPTPAPTVTVEVDGAVVDAETGEVVAEAAADEPVDAELMDEPITDEQLGSLASMLRECGFGKDEGLAFYAATIGREVGGSAELTSDEAEQVVAALGELLAEGAAS